jgi:hypothetical protein
MTKPTHLLRHVSLWLALVITGFAQAADTAPNASSNANTNTTKKNSPAPKKSSPVPKKNSAEPVFKVSPDKHVTQDKPIAKKPTPVAPPTGPMLGAPKKAGASISSVPLTPEAPNEKH